MLKWFPHSVLSEHGNKVWWHHQIRNDDNSSARWDLDQNPCKKVFHEGPAPKEIHRRVLLPGLYRCAQIVFKQGILARRPSYGTFPIFHASPTGLWECGFSLYSFVYSRCVSPPPCPTMLWFSSRALVRCQLCRMLFVISTNNALHLLPFEWAHCTCAPFLILITMNIALHNKKLL